MRPSVAPSHGLGIWEERREKAWRLLLPLQPCQSMEQVEPLVLQVETLMKELRGLSMDPDRDPAGNYATAGRRAARPRIAHGHAARGSLGG